MEATGIEGFSGIFSRLEDPRTGNARRHDGRPALDHDKLNAALLLVKNGLTPTQAAKQTGLGRIEICEQMDDRRQSPGRAAALPRWQDAGLANASFC